MQTLISNFFTAQICVVLLICLNFNISKAQLEFSNWIVGKNTIMHINPDGTTKLETYNGIYGDENKYFTQILSDKDGNPFIKIGHTKKPFGEPTYDISNYKFSMHYTNGDNCLTTLNTVNSIFPFMLKSPDNKYVYILYSDCSFEYTSKQLYKTKIYCFCKNNFDNSDKCKNILLYEFQGDYIGDVQQTLPFLCGISHTDGKSIWVLTKNLDTDSIVSIKLTGAEVMEKKKSLFHIDDGIFYVGTGTFDTHIRVSDCGIIYFDSQRRFVCSFFNQDEGIIEELKVINNDIHIHKSELSALRKYLYYTPNKLGNLYRVKFSDLEKGITTDNIEKLSPEIKKVYDIRIGIDGNLYIQTLDKNIWVVYDADSDTPQLLPLYDNIPDATIHFPNYLYTCELFSCKTSCDKSAIFSFPDRNEEIAIYEWNFGDGTTSNETNPVHYYDKSGFYTVSLSCTLKNGYKKIIPARTISIFETKFQKPKIIAE